MWSRIVLWAGACVTALIDARRCPGTPPPTVFFLSRCKLRCEKAQQEFMGARTPEDVVLVVLVGLSSHFYQARQSLGNHKLVHQVLVVLK